MAKDDGYCRVTMDQVSLEQTRAVIAALQEYLGLELQKRDRFYDEPEYRFVAK